MGKPTLYVSSRVATNPATGETYTAVSLTNRSSIDALDQAKEMLAMGYVIGVQPDTLAGILRAVAKYQSDKVRTGTSLNSDNLTLRLDVAGRANADGTLSADNVLKITAIPKDKAPELTDFTIVYTQDDGSAPKLQWCMSQGEGGVRGVIRKTAAISFDGVNLQNDVEATGDYSLRVAYPGDEEEVSVSVTPTTTGPNEITCAWPSALSDLAVGTKVKFTLTKQFNDASPAKKTFCEATIAAA